MLAFDSERHAYTWNGDPRPSVTDVLHLAGYASAVPDTPAAAVALTFGEHVHDLTALVDRRCDFVPRYRDVAVERVYRRFLANVRPTFTSIEQPRYSRRLQLAGTPDREGWAFASPFVLDIKTGQRDRFHALQLAGYDLLNPLPRGRRRRRFVLYIDSIDYTLDECASVADYNEFLSILERFNEHNR